jgi:hypothetical protein
MLRGLRVPELLLILRRARGAVESKKRGRKEEKKRKEK